MASLEKLKLETAISRCCERLGIQRKTLISHLNSLGNGNNLTMSKWEEGLSGTKASDLQVGGTHYSTMEIQPSEFNFRNNLNWLEGNAIKYICRHHAKGGAQDIDKAIHYLELLKEWHYGTTEDPPIRKT